MTRMTTVMTRAARWPCVVQRPVVNLATSARWLACTLADTFVDGALQEGTAGRSADSYRNRFKWPPTTPPRTMVKTPCLAAHTRRNVCLLASTFWWIESLAPPPLCTHSYVIRLSVVLAVSSFSSRSPLHGTCKQCLWTL